MYPSLCHVLLFLKRHWIQTEFLTECIECLRFISLEEIHQTLTTVKTEDDVIAKIELLDASSQFLTYRCAHTVIGKTLN